MQSGAHGDTSISRKTRIIDSRVAQREHASMKFLQNWPFKQMFKSHVLALQSTCLSFARQPCERWKSGRTERGGKVKQVVAGVAANNKITGRKTEWKSNTRAYTFITKQSSGEIARQRWKISNSLKFRGHRMDVSIHRDGPDAQVRRRPSREPADKSLLAIDSGATKRNVDCRAEAFSKIDKKIRQKEDADYAKKERRTWNT